MKSSTSALALALSILASTAAWANNIDPFGFEKEHFIASRSRAEVAADVQAARAAGQLPVAGEVGVRFADTPSTKSRSEVAADVQAARAAGQLPVAGEVGVRFADTPSTKSRAQVAAETREAARLGLLSYGEAGPKQPTPNQERQIESAGIQAVAHLAATRSASGRSGS